MFSKVFKYHFPVIAYLIIIFIVSSIPGDDLPELTFTFSDKILHGFVYIVAFLLFYYSFIHLKSDSIFYKYALLFSLIFTIVYAAFDEIHQSFVPNRDADFFDFLADFVGAILGFLFIITMRKIKYKKVII